SKVPSQGRQTGAAPPTLSPPVLRLLLTHVHRPTVLSCCPRRNARATGDGARPSPAGLRPRGYGPRPRMAAPRPSVFVHFIRGIVARAGPTDRLSLSGFSEEGIVEADHVLLVDPVAREQ